MLPSLTLLIACQLVGEIVTRLAGLPLPGPVLGLILLLAWLIYRGRIEVEMRETAGGLLRHLSLLFVPAGVGVITELSTLGREWLPIAVSLFVSTVLGLAVTAWLMQHLSGAPDDAP
jgi:putative effector of murein hydrolase LrgA (UPF0299 family)